MIGECEEDPFVPGYVLALQYNRYLSGDRGSPVEWHRNQI